MSGVVVVPSAVGPLVRARLKVTRTAILTPVDDAEVAAWHAARMGHNRPLTDQAAAYREVAAGAPRVRRMPKRAQTTSE
jgi:hypothetical protein